MKKKYKRIIVTTTINKPTKATIKFCKMKDWGFIIVGDLKTPHKEYIKLENKYKNVMYLHPKTQKKKFGKLSDIIGWNSIDRRNIGFIEAYNLGAEIIATVDDDNIPNKNWGENIYVNQQVKVDFYKTENPVFDPLSVTENDFLWHRGYPIELLNKRKNNTKDKKKRSMKVLVQADLWNGDPDIDAIARLAFSPDVKFDRIKTPYASNKISPFNSQNTFLSRDVFPYYSCIPHTGRMDDIWGGYILQYHLPNCVVYNKATVYQDRNKQDLTKNLEDEMIGYKNTLNLINDISNYKNYLPVKTKKFLKEYRKYFK